MNKTHERPQPSKDVRADQHSQRRVRRPRRFLPFQYALLGAVIGGVVSLLIVFYTPYVYALFVGGDLPWILGIITSDLTMPIVVVATVFGAVQGYTVGYVLRYVDTRLEPATQE